jgi:hypothetical protein
MDRLKALSRTSEFWVGLIVSVLQFLVAQNIIPQEMSDFIAGGVAYVVGRIISKLVKPAPPPAAG